MSLWGAIGSIVGSFVGGPAGGQIGGTIGGAIDGNNATKKAQRSQQAATDAAIAEQRRQFDLQYADQAPYRAAGVDALGKYQGEIGRMPTAEEVMAQPGYQFGLRQGQTGLDRKIAAIGGRVSGRALKAASQFNTDYAATGYGAEYQRREDRLNRLAALAGLGQTSTQASASAGRNSSNAISDLISSQGNANAASQISRGKIWANTGNQLAAIYGRSRTAGPNWASNGGTGYYDPNEAPG